MSVLIGLGSDLKVRTNLRYEGPCRLELLRSKLGVQLVWAPEVSVIALSGKESGSELAGAEISPNKTARVELGSIHSLRYHTLTSVNPALLEVAMVQIPQILEPGPQALNLVLTSRPVVDLSQFEYLVRLYLID